MPQFEVSSPDGRKVTLEGPEAPSDAELDGIFASLPQKPAEGQQSVRKSNPVDMAGLFEGVDKMDDALGRSAANELNTAIAGETDTKLAKMRAANTAFLAQQFGVAPDVVAANPEQYRKNYASQAMNLEADMDDFTFYGAVGAHLRTMKEEQGMMAGAAGQIYEAARGGKTFNETFAAWKEANRSTPGFNRLKEDYYRDYASKTYDFFRKNAERLSQPIDRVTAHMASLKKGAAPGTEEAVIAEHEEVIGLLSTLSPDDQELVLDFAAGAAAKQTAGEDDKMDGLEKASRRVERGLDSLIGSTAEFFAERLFTRPENLQARRDTRAINRKLIQRVTGEVDPLKGSTWISNGMMDAAESMPRMLVMLTPPGLVANLTATKQDIAGRYEDQGIPADQADILSSFAAPVYTALDFVSSKMVFKGKLPGIDKLLTAPMTSLGGLAGRTAIRGAGGMAEQFTQETLQDLTEPTVQSVASLMSDAVPEVDWPEQFAGISNSAPETFAALLPLVIIGTASGSFKDRAYGQEYLKNRQALEAVGMPAPVVEQILEAPTPEDAGAILKENWKDREEGTQTQKSAIQQLNEQAIKAREEMGEILSDRQKAILAKYPEEFNSMPPGHIPVEIQREDGTVYPAAINGFYELSETDVRASIGRYTGGGWSHGLPKPGETIRTPIPTAAQWAEGMRDVPDSPAGKRDETVSTGAGVETDFETKMVADWKKSIAAELAEKGIPPVNVTKAADGDFVVTDKASNAVIGTASSPEGAAQIVQDRKKDIEATANGPTSLKNEVVDAERKARGLEPIMKPARFSDQASWDEAARRLDANPNAASDLVEQLAKDPRLPSKTESALLLRHKILLRHERTLANEAVVKAQESGDAAEIEKATFAAAKAEERLAQLDQVTEAAGTELGRGLQARRMMAEEDYTLAAMESRRRAANEGKPLTKEQQAETQKLFDQITALQKELEALKAAKAEPAVQPDETPETGRKRQKKAPPASEGVRAFLSKQAEAARQRIAERMKEGRAMSGIDPADFADHVIVGADLIAKGVTKAAEFTAAMVKEFGERISPFIDDIRKAAEIEVDRVKIETLLEQRKAQLKAQIEELRKTIEAGGTTEASRTASRPSIQEIETLEQERDALRTDLSDLRKRSQRVEDLKEAIAEKERKLSEGDLSTEGTAKNRPSVEAIETLRQERDALNKQLEAARKEAAKPTEEARIEKRVTAINKRVAEIREMLAGGDLTPEGREQNRPQVEAIETALRERDALNKQLADARKGPPKDPTEAKLAALKTRQQKQIAELERRIEEGDFTPPAPRTPVERDEAALRMEAQIDLLKLQYEAALEKDRYDKMSALGKAASQLVSLYDSARNIMLSGDLGYLWRQGGLTFFSRPGTWAKAIPDTLKALAADKVGSLAINKRILDDPLYPQAKAAKLALSEFGASLRQQEEYMIGKYTEKTPVLRNINQAGVVFLNRIRFDSWKALRQMGGVPTPETDRAFARLVNETTGRGSLPGFEKAAVTVARIGLAPRFVTSRFQYALGNSLWQAPNARSRAVIAFEYARTAAGLGALYGLVKFAAEAFYDDDDENKPTVEFDARSADFGKVKVGNTRFDPLSGIAQAVVFMNRIRTGEVKSTTSGNVRDFTGEDLYRFARSKLNAIPAAAENLRTGEDLGGEESTIQSELTKLFFPITYREIIQAYNKEDADEATIAAALMMMGVGVQRYRDAEEAEEQRMRRAERRYEKAVRRAEESDSD